MTHVKQNIHSAPIGKIILAFAIIYLIWGSTYLGIRFAVETLPPFLMAAVRFIVAGVILFAALKLGGAPMPSRIEWRSTAIVGAFLLLGGNGLVTWSEQTIPSGLAALIVATLALWMVMLEWIIFKGPRPSKQVVLGLVIGFGGVALLIGPDSFRAESGINPIHVIGILLAPMLWSIGSLYARRAPLPDSSLMATAMQMMLGGVLLLVAGLVSGEAARVNLENISTRSLVALAYLTLFGSIVAYSAYVWLLKVTTPARVATYAYVNPVIAVFLGWLLGNEAVNVRTLIAAAAIIAAVFLITVTRRKRSVEIVQRIPEPEVVPAPVIK